MEGNICVRSTNKKESAMDQWLRMVAERICCGKATAKGFLFQKKENLEEFKPKNYHCGEAILERYFFRKV